MLVFSNLHFSVITYLRRSLLMANHSSVAPHLQRVVSRRSSLGACVVAVLKVQLGLI